jgi:hypothetical protein
VMYGAAFSAEVLGSAVPKGGMQCFCIIKVLILRCTNEKRGMAFLK